MDMATQPQNVTPSGTVSAVVSSSDFPPHSDNLKLNLTKKIMEFRVSHHQKSIFLFQDQSTVDANQNLTFHSKCCPDNRTSREIFRFFSWSRRKWFEDKVWRTESGGIQIREILPQTRSDVSEKEAVKISNCPKSSLAFLLKRICFFSIIFLLSELQLELVVISLNRSSSNKKSNESSYVLNEILVSILEFLSLIWFHEFSSETSEPAASSGHFLKRHLAENFLSYRKSKNGCFEINIELENICDALFNDLIHKFVRFTNFAKI
jgi:hypothetical protein